MKKVRKKTRKLNALFIVIIILMLWLINNYTIKVTSTEITSDKVKNPVRLVVLSDLHGDKFGPDNSYLKKKIKAEKPDIILIVGDMYSNGDEVGKQTAIELMTSLESPVYFVPGEHDRDKDYFNALTDKGVNVLSYDVVTVKVGKTYIDIYGINNAYFSDSYDLSNEFTEVNTKSFSILMAHIPFYSQYEKFGTDLTVCGDTHGGVAQLPFVGPVYCGGEWFPDFSSDNTVYDKGFFKYKGGGMYITSGLGKYPSAFRFNNRPEVTVIDILPNN